jgi:UDP-glucose:(heptosyl)LPS alpha-1,3-glucosyltransferase
MACGLPVITTIQNGASDMIQHDQDGYVFDKQDTAALNDHLERLVDPERRQAMAQAARRRAEEYSLQHNFEALYQVYTRVLNRRQASRASVA